MLTRERKRLWIVEGGYGIWVVRAATEERAIEVAAGPLKEQTGWAEFGLERDEISARELSPAGPDEVIDYIYA